MSNIVDIRDKLNPPDAACIWKDQNGENWFKYSVRYLIDDRVFSFSIWAQSMKDAQERLDLLKTNAEIEGQIFGEYTNDRQD